ncbi:hypothetical protein BJ875DRAFT_458281 [Amylocarpus encephaloides]|uniref:Uncharacterized protein n=1 Tax=Amylocarpus encephaloides TaxID=45428 RepID=A0A9P8C6Y6_9HELO|nr:hypothetical protein BJ875DRAFT_458281 [Amylocarpus encephaloides]
MPYHGIDYEELTRDLITNFNALADAVQLLSDRNTILQYKLQYAHTEYQVLADKYAASDPGIAETLAKLQLPPDLQVTTPDRAGFIPLPIRGQGHSKQQIAEAIRDGRKAVQRLAVLGGKSTGSTSISGTSSSMRLSAQRTSLSTVLEQDFTVPGKKGSLLCPFTQPTRNPKPSSTMGSTRPLTPSDGKDPTPHRSADPICAAMYAETMSSPPPSATDTAPKCPIRYLDQHSPEEVAKYFETHKHEIPRSHEVCVKRYQRNEDDIRKLDAKYGNLVSMIQGLGEKHQPMLPADADQQEEDLESTSIERVENWANAVSADGVGHDTEEVKATKNDDDDRESRFDRPLKEVRVGESPSRPWGISVPIFDPPSEDQRPVSPPPAPVSAEHIPKPIGKCPFGHGQQEVKVEKEESQAPDFNHFEERSQHQSENQEAQRERPPGKCPFGHGKTAKLEENPRMPSPPPAAARTQTAFIQPPFVPQMGGGAQLPQMIFTGPVFIGYPMEQAMAFMQQYKNM